MLVFFKYTYLNGIYMCVFRDLTLANSSWYQYNSWFKKWVEGHNYSMHWLRPWAKTFAGDKCKIKR